MSCSTTHFDSNSLLVTFGDSAFDIQLREVSVRPYHMFMGEVGLDDQIRIIHMIGSLL